MWPFARRARVAAASLAIAAVAFHTFVADALVSRGDELLRGGDLAGARRAYGRAMVLDPDAETAIDRAAFVALIAPEPAALEEGLRASERYLGRHPGASSIRFERGLDLYIAHRDREAARELLRAGTERHDFRALGLAAHAAARAGEPDLERAGYRAALALNPRYAVARRALAARPR